MAAGMPGKYIQIVAYLVLLAMIVAASLGLLGEVL
jgi:hypothetical protein